MMFWHGWYGGWGFPLAGWLGLLAFVLFVVLVVWAIASLVGRRPPQTDEAEAILRARLARGEISVEEYEQTRRILGLK
jgi:putative membrane protein